MNPLRKMLPVSATLVVASAVLADLAVAEGQQTPGSPTTTGATAFVAAQSTPRVEVVKALAWPITALLIAFIFRRPFGALVTAFGTRVTKLSLFQVELELVPATSAASTPLIDDIRTATVPAQISDSSRMMLDQVQSGSPADYALIPLGTGNEWITSRLFIAAAMLERMRGVRALVFVESTATGNRRLVAVAPVEVVRWALARRYPHLEAAWARSYLGVIPTTAAGALPPDASWLPDPKTLALSQSLFTSNTGAMEPWAARQLVSRFVDSLQRPPASPTATPTGADWVLLGQNLEERAEFVTRELLNETLPSSAFLAWSDEFIDAPRVKRTRAILRRSEPFVALTRGDREFVRLVNRRALLEDVASSIADEPHGAE